MTVSKSFFLRLQPLDFLNGLALTSLLAIDHHDPIERPVFPTDSRHANANRHSSLLLISRFRNSDFKSQI